MIKVSSIKLFWIEIRHWNLLCSNFNLQNTFGRNLKIKIFLFIIWNLIDFCSKFDIEIISSRNLTFTLCLIEIQFSKYFWSNIVIFYLFIYFLLICNRNLISDWKYLWSIFNIRSVTWMNNPDHIYFIKIKRMISKFSFKTHNESSNVSTPQTSLVYKILVNIILYQTFFLISWHLTFNIINYFQFRSRFIYYTIKCHQIHH